MEDRYYVDKRVGCIAVRDHTLDNEDEPGLHEDTTGVVKYWHGSNSPEFGWGVSELAVSEAYDEAMRLNNLPEVEAGLHEDTAGVPKLAVSAYYKSRHLNSRLPGRATARDFIHSVEALCIATVLKSGVSPDTLYLGQREKHLLTELATHLAHYTADNKTNGIEFLGLQVVFVEVDEYINVGTKP